MATPKRRIKKPTGSLGIVSGPESERLWNLQGIEALKAETEKHRAEAAVLWEDLRERQHERALREAVAAERRVFDFVGDVEESRVGAAVDELNDWAIRSKDPIRIRINSPGGEVFAGLMLFDYIQELRRDGIEVTTHCVGYAASMAAIILQAGDRRTMTRNSWFMVHEPSGLALGKASEMKDEAALITKLHKQLVGILAERSTLTAAKIKLRCERKDWWMPGEDALKYGFVDELI